MPSLKELPTRPDPARRSKLNRRQALSLLATGMASGLAACSNPNEQILPYVRMPERIVPGEPLKFATTLALAGIGRGVIVTSIDGRPIKVEGNPLHPNSLGATDVFAEAAVLSLYDPDRSHAILHNGAIASREALRGALVGELSAARNRHGDGLRLLTARTTSPTLLRQIDAFLQTFPGAAWHAYDPTDDESARQGAQLAFGQPVCSIADFAKARVIVALDADPLGHGPDQIRIGRGFAEARRGAGAFSRLYCLESALTLTGAKADERLALHPDAIERFAAALAERVGSDGGDIALPEPERGLLNRIVTDLGTHKGEALVLTGPTMSEDVHALVYWINAQLNAPVRLIGALDQTPSGKQAGTLEQLATDLDAGRVQQLVVVGANPLYHAPADLRFEARVQKARFRLHMGAYADETAAIATWHVPQSHPLEAWSDLRASDGTASIVQPLIRPLHASFGDHELLAWLLGAEDASAHALVQETWRTAASGDFEPWWQRALHDGVIAGSAADPVTSAAPRPPSATMRELGHKANELTLVLRPDPCLWDGSFANNAWLQECPKPLSKQVWGNALSLHPDEANRLELSTGDMVRISANGRSLEVPVLSEPGTATGVSALTLGGGRQKAGAIGNGVGANAFAIRTAENSWRLPHVSIQRTGRREPILTTQNVVRTPEDVRELYPQYLVGQPLPAPAKPDHPSLLPTSVKPDQGHAWAMVIDTSLCIGCNACVVSCQAENNIPVVGPEQVAMGRDMHWIRVDAYDHGSANSPQIGFQPVPCMHCEHAPCEPVCPVAASVHDSEGLNGQVYNRCIGTRFCEANCPYKVRRFNFFGYADGEEYGNLGAESYRGQKNPEVTVRARGVMEKCTYCVQRISGARRASEREDRPLGIDEVRTACQNACPTRAISFGDLNQADAEINHRKGHPRHYALLGHLGTRPRTTYLADLRNPAPPKSDGQT